MTAGASRVDGPSVPPRGSEAGTRSPRRLRGLVVALVGALAIGAGATTGGTLALWRDREVLTARMPAAVVSFGARTLTAPATATDWATGPGDTVEAAFGPGLAATLYDSGAVAVAFQVDSLSQGHRGLRYTVAEDVVGGVFGAATRRVFPVASPGLCTTTAAGTPATTATPWAAGPYTTSTATRAEYWCLVATFDKVQGAYANTASVVADVRTSTGTVADALRAQASWSAQVLKAIDPAAERTHRLTFRFETFRGTTP